MKRNKKLFDKIAKVIERKPELYNQHTWGEECETETSCGTAHCVAGWAASLSGALPRLLDDGPWWGEVFTPGKRWRNVDGYASRKLGLTGEEADELFSPHWKPALGESVSEALRDIGRGGKVVRRRW